MQRLPKFIDHTSLSSKRPPLLRQNAVDESEPSSFTQNFEVSHFLVNETQKQEQAMLQYLKNRYSWYAIKTVK